MSEFQIGVPLMNEPEAKAAAKSKAKDLKRETTTASCTVVGNPAIRAGAPLTFANVRVGVDGIPFIIESATHSFSKAGYTTSIEAKLKVSGSGGGSGAASTPTGGEFVIGEPA